MRAGIRLVIAAVGLAGLLLPQFLAPDVLLLARVKAHTREELARLPNCSCLETVRRERRAPGRSLEPLDVLRLEVLYSDGKEYYASPGEGKFAQNHPNAFTGTGTTGNGHFALFLHEIAGERGPSYEYKGNELSQGRTLARWDYRVPLNGSGHIIDLGGGDTTVGIKGSFWADPATYEIVRIQMAADEIPLTLPVLSSETWIEYAHTKLGGRDYLLPQTAESRLVRFTGEESRNHIEFTHCHLFTAQSSVSFGQTPEFPSFTEDSLLNLQKEVPPGLPVVLKVSTPISSNLAVGALVESTVEGNVSHKKQVVIPAGSVVRGRVRGLEKQGGSFVVTLEFTDVEAGATRYRFFADLQSVDGVTGLQRPRDGKWLSELPGVGAFAIDPPLLEVPQGFHMLWKTRSVAP